MHIYICMHMHMHMHMCMHMHMSMSMSMPMSMWSQVRPKSCVFVNFALEAVAVALQARYAGAAGDMADFGGARLNVNFAKARPCPAELLRQVDDGARRMLALTLRTAATEACVRVLLGESCDALLGCEPQGEPAEAAAAEAAAADSPSAASAAGPTYMGFVLDFSSIAGAVAAKAALEAAQHGNMEPPAAVEYVAAAVLSAAEIEAMMPRQADAGLQAVGPTATGSDASPLSAMKEMCEEIEAEIEAGGSADAAVVAQPKVKAAAPAAKGEVEVAAM